MMTGDSQKARGHRLLVVSYHAPPSPAVGGLRWWGLSKYLARLGWDVTLVAEGQPSANLNVAGVRTVRIPRRTTLQDRYRRWRTRNCGSVREVAQNSDDVTRYPPGSLAARIRRELAETLAFPDEARGWLIRALVETRALVRNWMPDVIVSSGPPHSVHAMARCLGANQKTRYVMDYRDPWRGQTTSPIGAAALEHLEGRLLASTSLVTCVTPEQMAAIQRLNHMIPVRWLSNGCDAEMLPARNVPTRDVPEIVHLGSVYSSRTPMPLLRAFERYSVLEGGAAFKARLRFIGSVEPAYLGMIEQFRAKGFSDAVSVEAPLPRAAALEILAGADLAVVLATGQQTQVPAKLFESVAMNVPTLVIAEQGSASANAAQQIGAIHHVPEDVAGMAKTFLAVARNQLPPLPQGPSRMSHASLASEADGMLRHLLTPASIYESSGHRQKP
jgi:hypothetical protein